MQKMVVKGRRPLRHDGRQFAPGETFEASDVDARFYRRRNMADDAPVPVVVVTPPKTQRAPSPSAAPAPTPATPAPAPEPQRVSDDEVAKLLEAKAEPSSGEGGAVAEGASVTAPAYRRRDLRAES